MLYVDADASNTALSGFLQSVSTIWSVVSSVLGGRLKYNRECYRPKYGKCWRTCNCLRLFINLFIYISIYYAQSSKKRHTTNTV